MKIEKLTENKIRVIVKPDDLKIKNTNDKSLYNVLENQTFFANILEKAKLDFGFVTDGYKLLIETFSLNNDFIIFTITKYSKPIVKKKQKTTYSNNAICKFDNFEEFCIFCKYINTISSFNYKSFSKNYSLYLYKNTYYLLIKDINNSLANSEIFHSIISEFAECLSFSTYFENRLIEYGKIIIKKNAIEKVIKYFS